MKVTPQRVSTWYTTPSVVIINQHREATIKTGFIQNWTISLPNLEHQMLTMKKFNVFRPNVIFIKKNMSPFIKIHFISFARK